MYEVNKFIDSLVEESKEHLHLSKQVFVRSSSKPQKVRLKNKGNKLKCIVDKSPVGWGIVEKCMSDDLASDKKDKKTKDFRI